MGGRAYLHKDEGVGWEGMVVLEVDGFKCFQGGFFSTHIPSRDVGMGFVFVLYRWVGGWMGGLWMGRERRGRRFE